MAADVDITNSVTAAPPPIIPIETSLDTIRAKYNLPSLAGAIFTTDGIIDIAAVGVRKVGEPTAVTKDDLWHLGSDTKMMTAALLGTFVAEKKVSWDDTVISFFPDIVSKVPESMRKITISQVLSHEAGLVENLDFATLSHYGTLKDQRIAVARLALAKPSYAPGAFHYSNVDYVVIGAIIEKLGGKSWEELMQERIFKPLGMDSAGFGGLGTPGQVDQPWPHGENGMAAPMNGPTVDNPPNMAPAGTVHCTMTDWSKFLVDQLRGGLGMKALLPTEIYRRMQSPASPKGQMGFGWAIVDRSWADGDALTHSGSNTMNFCVCWLAPKKKFGVLICTNQGGANAPKGTDDAASALIVNHIQKTKDKP